MEKPVRSASRHEVSENLIERSLEIQEQIDKAENCIEAMDIEGLFDLRMINRRDYQDWLRAERNEQDLVDTYGDAFDPSFRHYYNAMDKADKNIKRLQKEVDGLVGKSRHTLRQASRVESKTAASGNYGYTKRVQNDVDVALRKLEKKVDQLARSVESKHPEAGSYFGLRCKGTNCNASKALSKACLLNQPPKRLGNGPLGFKPSCAKSAHKAITDLTIYCGEIAHSLYNKNRDHMGYMKTHAKKKRCPLTKMILENYPVELL